MNTNMTNMSGHLTRPNDATRIDAAEFSDVDQNVNNRGSQSNRVSRGSSSKADDGLIGYRLGKVLGEGSYAKVRICDRVTDNKRMAAKVINLEKAAKDFKDKFLPRELNVMKTLNHPNIVELIDIIKGKDERGKEVKCYIIMEMAGQGDLLEYIKGSGRLEEPKAQIMFRQLIEALDYMHRYQKVCHRDLKCENILLDKFRNLKVSDFGFARIYGGDPSTTYCGSAAYAAPEVLRGTPYKPEPYDVWSCGVVLFIMLVGAMPFEDKDHRQMIHDQLNSKYTIPARKKLTEVAIDIIRIMFDPNPNTRPLFSELKNHPWQKEVKYIFYKDKGDNKTKTLIRKSVPDESREGGRKASAKRSKNANQNASARHSNAIFADDQYSGEAFFEPTSVMQLKKVPAQHNLVDIELCQPAPPCTEIPKETDPYKKEIDILDCLLKQEGIEDPFRKGYAVRKNLPPPPRPLIMPAIEEISYEEPEIPRAKTVEPKLLPKELYGSDKAILMRAAPPRDIFVSIGNSQSNEALDDDDDTSPFVVKEHSTPRVQPRRENEYGYFNTNDMTSPFILKEQTIPRVQPKREEPRPMEGKKKIREIMVHPTAMKVKTMDLEEKMKRWQRLEEEPKPIVKESVSNVTTSNSVAPGKFPRHIYVSVPDEVQLKLNLEDDEEPNAHKALIDCP